MTMVMVFLSSLAAILAQWIVTMAMFMPGACASSFPSHVDEFASSDEPNMMSRLGGEL